MARHPASTILSNGDRVGRYVEKDTIIAGVSTVGLRDAVVEAGRGAASPDRVSEKVSFSRKAVEDKRGEGELLGR